MASGNLSLLISVIAVLIAAFSLGWNIYRDIIIKPKVKIDLSIRMLITPGSSDSPQYIVLTATNFGPGVVTISTIQVQNTSSWKRILKKEKLGIIIHDFENPLSGQLPARLDVGSKIDLLLRYDQECFLNEEWTHVGVYDYFGKCHWASKKQIKEARAQWINDFGLQQTSI